MDLSAAKIVVTGGRGFVGRHVVAELLRRGVPEGNINVPAEGADLRVRKEAEDAVRGADLVIHLAAVTGGIEFHRAHPASILFDNLALNLEVLDAARRAGVQKFVGIGSATEYPEHIPVPYVEKDLWQGPPEGIHAPYSHAKRMLFVQGQAYRSEYGLNAIHLLPTNMYGPGEAVTNGYVIPALIGRMREAKKTNAPCIEAWGTGRAAREFLFVEDAARAIVLAAEKYDEAEPVNIGSGEEISIKELTVMIAEGVGYGGEIRWDASKPDGQLRRALDVSRAAEKFGFRAEIPMRTGLARTIAWHEESL